MNYFLYHLTLNASHHDPGSWSEEDHAAIEKHVTFLDQLGKDGHLIFAGRTDLPFDDPMLFGIALIRAKNMMEATTLMAGDPAVIQCIQSARILPYRLAIDHFSNAVDQTGD